MPSLTEELEQAQKERFETETKLHQDLSDAERKATGNRVKELKAQEKEISNLRKKELEEALHNQAKRKERGEYTPHRTYPQPGIY